MISSGFPILSGLGSRRFVRRAERGIWEGIFSAPVGAEDTPDWLPGQDGRCVGLNRVKRIRRGEGLKVPIRQPERRRLWLNDGSCIRLCPTAKNQCPDL